MRITSKIEEGKITIDKNVKTIILALDISKEENPEGYLADFDRQYLDSGFIQLPTRDYKTLNYVMRAYGRMK